MNMNQDQGQGHRSIFRARALQSHMAGKEETILPKMVRPKVFIFLWILVGLLMAASLLAWLTKVPIYHAGTAVVTTSGKDEVALLVMVAPNDLPYLQINQPVRVDVAGSTLSYPIMSVEPEIMSPSAVQQQFSLPVGTVGIVTQPIAVAIARFEPLPGNLPPSAYTGSTYSITIETGSRRVLSLIPLLGQFFQD